MSLTSTEERIAGLVAHGHRNHEVAAQLSLSPKTIEWHLSRLYRKLGVRSRTELSVLVLKGNPVGPSRPKDEPNGRLRFGPGHRPRKRGDVPLRKGPALHFEPFLSVPGDADRTFATPDRGFRRTKGEER